MAQQYFGSSSIIKLEEELCVAYKRLLSSEQRLLEALSRIKELEDRERLREEENAKQRSGNRRKAKANTNPIQLQENDENENKNDGVFQVSVRTSYRKPDLKVVDANMVTPKKQQHSERSPKSINSKKSDKSVRFAQFSIESPVFERINDEVRLIGHANKREAAVAILTQQAPQCSATKERPPFIPGGGAGNSYFNLHSLKQKREKERKEENRPRHRGIVQQQQQELYQQPRTPLRNEW